MNKMKIMRDAFDFLLKEGFDFSIKKSNIEYCIVYSSSRTSIVLNYDLRSRYFDVGIMSIENDWKSYIPIFESSIGNKTKKEKVIDKINIIYNDAEKDWTITKGHFSEIVNLYAEFVSHNLKEIKNIWT